MKDEPSGFVFWVSTFDRFEIPRQTDMAVRIIAINALMTIIMVTSFLSSLEDASLRFVALVVSGFCCVGVCDGCVVVVLVGRGREVVYLEVHFSVFMF